MGMPLQIRQQRRIQENKCAGCGQEMTYRDTILHDKDGRAYHRTCRPRGFFVEMSPRDIEQSARWIEGKAKHLQNVERLKA
jgi:hypothetical protein